MSVEIELREAWSRDHARLFAVEKDGLSTETREHAWEAHLNKYACNETSTAKTLFQVLSSVLAQSNRTNGGRPV